MSLLKQSTTFNFLFSMVQSTDSTTPLTGVTPVVNLTKAGAGFGAAAGTVTEIGNGFYQCAFTTADTGTLGDLGIYITATGGDPISDKSQVFVDIPGGSVSSVTGAVGSVTGAVGSVTGAVGSVTGAVGSVTAGVTVTTNNDKTGYALSSAGVQAIWDALTSALTTTGSIGKLLVTAIPNAVAGATGGLFIAGTNAATTITTALTTTFTGNLTGSVGSVTGAVGSVIATVSANLTQILGTALTETSGQIAAGFKKFFNIASPTSTMNEITLVDTVTTATTATNLTTNNDKTGYALSNAGVQAVWDALTSALTTVGSIGKLLVTNINATISSTLTTSHFDTITGTPVTSVSADIAAVETSAVAIKAKTDNLPASPAAVGSAMTLTSGERISIAAAVWNALTSGLTTVSSIGKLLVDNITTSLSSLLTTSHFDTIIGIPSTTVAGDILAIQPNAATLSQIYSALPTVQGRAFPGYEFTMYDSTTGLPKTGLTVTGKVYKNGADGVAITNAVTELSHGVYTVDLDGADLNGLNNQFTFSATGALDTRFSILTSPS